MKSFLKIWFKKHTGLAIISFLFCFESIAQDIQPTEASLKTFLSDNRTSFRKYLFQSHLSHVRQRENEKMAACYRRTQSWCPNIVDGYIARQSENDSKMKAYAGFSYGSVYQAYLDVCISAACIHKSPDSTNEAITNIKGVDREARDEVFTPLFEVPQAKAITPLEPIINESHQEIMARVKAQDPNQAVPERFRGKNYYQQSSVFDTQVTKTNPSPTPLKYIQVRTVPQAVNRLMTLRQKGQETIISENRNRRLREFLYKTGRLFKAYLIQKKVDTLRKANLTNKDFQVCYHEVERFCTDKVKLFLNEYKSKDKEILYYYGHADNKDYETMFLSYFDICLSFRCVKQEYTKEHDRVSFLQSKKR